MMRCCCPSGVKSSVSGVSCAHSIPPLSPNTRSFSPFTEPVATWLAHSMPRASPKRSMHVDIVVDLAARNEGREVGRDRLRLQAGDELGELEGMRRDIAERAAGAGLRRIAAPVGLLVAGQVGGEPVLRILDLHDADGAELARLDHRARLPRHRIAGVVVRQDEGQAGLGHDLGEIIARACA